MDRIPLYIYIDKQTIEVQREKSHHLGGDGSFYVELCDPVLTFDRDGTSEQWQEFSAKLAKLIATAYGEQP